MWQIGIVVPDRDAAMVALSDAFGLTWIRADRSIDAVTVAGPETIELGIALAQQGPVHLEVIGAAEGSPWYPGHGLDHIAYWADDLAGTAARMEAVGFTREVSYQGDVQPNGFAYHRAPSGLRIEHVDAARRTVMMGWIAGGAYPELDGGSQADALPELVVGTAYAGDGPAIGSAFHVGATVVDLDAAMAELTAALGIEWHSVQEMTMNLRTANGVGPVHVRFTYSKQTPHIELLQGDPGSVWGPENVGIHHIGVWTDDLARDSAALTAKGFAVEATQAGNGSDGPVGFTYQQSDVGIRVELVPTSSRAAFDSWFGGGDFG